jgi:hypothetical protein
MRRRTVRQIRLVMLTPVSNDLSIYYRLPATLTARLGDSPVPRLRFSGEMNVLPPLGQKWRLAISRVITSTDCMPAKSGAAMPT